MQKCQTFCPPTIQVSISLNKYKYAFMHTIVFLKFQHLVYTNIQILFELSFAFQTI